MAANFIAAFAAPAVALIALGAGAAPRPAAFGGDGAEPVSLSSQQARAHATAVFARADLDRSGDLDADEYSALAVVSAGLARLNGYVAILGVDEALVAPLPAPAPRSLSAAERTRIEAVARADFYAASGADARMSAAEYGAEQDARFAAADRNRNGRLAKGELASFGAAAAAITGAAS